MRMPDRLMQFTDMFLMEATQTLVDMQEDYDIEPDEELREAMIELGTEVVQVMKFKEQDESQNKMDLLVLRNAKQNIMDLVEAMGGSLDDLSTKDRPSTDAFEDLSLPDGVTVGIERSSRGPCYHFTHDELGYIGRIVVVMQEDGFEFSTELPDENYNSIPMRHMMNAIGESMSKIFEASGAVRMR